MRIKSQNDCFAYNWIIPGSKTSLVGFDTAKSKLLWVKQTNGTAWNRHIRWLISILHSIQFHEISRVEFQWNFSNITSDGQNMSRKGSGWPTAKMAKQTKQKIQYFFSTKLRKQTLSELEETTKKKSNWDMASFSFLAGNQTEEWGCYDTYYWVRPASTQ